jgi:hypothetical protein
MSRPGKNVAHQPPMSTISLPKAMTDPQDEAASCGESPPPMKDRDASKTMASATITVVNTMIGAAQLRRMCFHRMCGRRAPMIRSAAT